MINFFIKGVPLAWKAPYVGCKGAYSVRTPIKDQIQNYLKSIYNKPLISQPICVDVTFYMPIPKSISLKKRAKFESGEILHDKRPDVSNLLKFAHDLLIGTIIVDDSIIFDGRATKRYGEPGTLFKIYLPNEFRLED